MTSTTWVSLLNAGQYNQTQVGAAYASSSSIADVSPGAATLGQCLSIPASFMQPGMKFHIRANGIVSNTATPTLVLGLYWDGVAGVALCTTGAVATSSSLSNNTWALTADLRVESVGTSGAFRTVGSVSGPYASTAFMPVTSSSGNQVTVDTSIAKKLTIGATWGASSSSNTLTVMQYDVWSLQF